ncbi:MAG: orotidine-5'-phosphate decarboxylase [Nitritalea sp.]
MKKSDIVAQMRQKQSCLCVGLDASLEKIPSHLRTEKDPILTFNKRIIDATEAYAVAYKPNVAFYEALGPKGWETLAETLAYIPKNCLTIADAKRGDIGNTAEAYAKAFFDVLDVDSVTLAPYMGADSIQPFLGRPGKWAIVLGLTSNEGSADFQMLTLADGSYLFESVVRQLARLGSAEELMLVVGATRGEYIAKVRAAAPEHFFLVPGVGAQGGSLADVIRYGATADGGILVNSSRGILFAGSGLDFAEHAAAEAKRLQEEMARLFAVYGVLQ